MKNEDEEELIIEEGNEDTFYTADGGNIFGIGFDKLFEKDELVVYNNFEMNSKRNFRNLSSAILETYNEIFLDEGGRFNEDLALILFNIISVKSKIVTNDKTTYEEFIALLDKITDDGDSLLLTTLSTYVEENYALDLDGITKASKDKKKKINEELQFKDSHAKVLLKIAYLYRIIIPLISVYFVYNKGWFPKTAKGTTSTDDEIEFDDINYSIFAHLFEKYANDPENKLRNKLYKLTYSKVSRTGYSDKKFWLAAENVAISSKSVSLDIYEKLLTNAIPKMSIDGDKNIVSFLTSVINNQIDFLFQNKFKDRITTIGNRSQNYSSEDDDSDSMTEFEQMQIQLTRKDEGSYIIRQLNIQRQMENIPTKMDVGIEDAEVKALIQDLNRNPIQEQLVAMMTLKYFNDRDAIGFLSFYQYATLVIACKKFLEKHKFVYLPQIITANCEKHKERTNICGKKVRPEILSSKKFKDLFASKYKNFSDDVERPFLAFIGTVYSSVFRDKDGNEIFDSSVKVAKIADEVLDLARLV